MSDDQFIRDVIRYAVSWTAIERDIGIDGQMSSHDVNAVTEAVFRALTEDLLTEVQYDTGGVTTTDLQECLELVDGHSYRERTAYYTPWELVTNPEG